MPRGSLAKTAYPDSLLERERVLLIARRKAADLGRPPTDGATPGRLGVALSGGGIRSATFCLGVFQALAGKRRLGAIDYISSVSGGGYFASFLGRLFARQGVDIKTVEQILSPIADQRSRDLPKDHAAGNPQHPHWTGQIFDWLRENGRYLAPKGGGDLILASAIALRNWATIQVFIAIPLLWFFLSLRIVAAGAREEPVCAVHRWSCIPAMPGAHWSPYLWLAALIFGVLVMPLGWAYWLMPPAHRTWRDWAPWVTAILVSGMAAAALLFQATSSIGKWLAVIVLVVAFLTIVIAAIYAILWRRRLKSDSNAADLTEADQRILASETSRSDISGRFRTVLVVFAAVLLIALIDSAGQWVGSSARSAVHSTRLEHLLAAIFTVSAAVAPAARWLVINFKSPKADAPPSLSLNLIASIAAGLLLLIIAISADVGAEMIRVALCGGAWRLALGWIGLAVLLGLSGLTWSFVNNSSLQALYGGRLVRAYLGASNWTRLADDGPGLSTVIPGDDISQERYWPGAQSEQIRRGAPLHLVNVTLNETLDGQSQIEQRDRKGLPLAAGPSGISVGVQHHLMLDCQASGQDKIAKIQRPGCGGAGLEVAGIEPSATAAFRVFEYPDDAFPGESMSLGKWTAISGAAVATGVGSRTSLGLSLLAGLFNVRLGYWWDSGVNSRNRKKATKRPLGRMIGRLINAILPAQTYLLDEFMGRFHGTARRYWYLSDGGHFENMGAYELIRRRLPFIVVVDAEGDPDYAFPGMAGLVRKARLDFGAEIMFLDEVELDATVRPRVRPYFGALEQLRRGTWSDEPVLAPGTSRKRLTVDPRQTGWSLAHAALAKITYDGQPATQSWLLLVKPTLTGDEPADVLRYHADHPAFPHESTAEQFFNEAQWESYRRLGQHITELILDGLDDTGGELFSSLMRN